MTALDDLAATARAATAGPWHATMDNPGREPRFIDASESVRIARAARTADAAYIAAASPDRVLALVAVARAGEARWRAYQTYQQHSATVEWDAYLTAANAYDAAIETALEALDGGATEATPAPSRGKRTGEWVLRQGHARGRGDYMKDGGKKMRFTSREQAVAGLMAPDAWRPVALVRREPRDWAKLIEEHAALTARVASLADVEAARGDPGCGTHAQAVADALIDAAKWVMLEASLFDEGKRLGAELVKRAVKVAGADYVALRLP